MQQYDNTKNATIQKYKSTNFKPVHVYGVHTGIQKYKL